MCKASIPKLRIPHTLPECLHGLMLHERATLEAYNNEGLLLTPPHFLCMRRPRLIKQLPSEICCWRGRRKTGNGPTM